MTGLPIDNVFDIMDSRKAAAETQAAQKAAQAAGEPAVDETEELLRRYGYVHDDAR